MANGEAHVVLHCLVFPAMEVGGDQAGGQAGEEGDEVAEHISSNHYNTLNSF